MQDIMTFISQHPVLSATAIAVLLTLLIVELLRLKRNTISISPLQATQLINHDNAIIIDLRANEAFKKGHIIDAQSITASEIQKNSKKIEKFKGKPIILVCHLGVESQKVAASLQKQGYNVYSLRGGMRAWSEATMPVVKD